MVYSLNQTVAPETEPISLLEATNHLRILPDDAVPDAYINSIISVAREKIENEISRALITQTWQATGANFPWSSNCPIELELPPLQDVNSVKFVDTDGNEQTWSPSLYQVNTKSTPGFILPKDGESYPETGSGVINSITIEFVAGYGNAGKVPSPIRHAMKLIVGELYARREEAIVGAAITTVPVSAQNLISPYKIVHF